MKYRYCVSILTLSTIVFFSVNFVKDRRIFAAEAPAVSISTPVTPGIRATESELKYFAIQEEIRQKYEIRLAEQEEKTRKLELLLTALSNLVEQAIAEKMEFAKKIESLSEQLEKLSQRKDISQPTPVESAPAKKVEKTKVTPTKKVEEPLKKEISEGTTKQMKIDEKSGKSTSVDQYVKVRVKDGDQEVEMVLDPTYTDMAFEFQGKKRPTELKIEPETVEEVLPPTKSDIQVKKSIEKIMKKIDELSYDIAELKSEKGPLLAVPPSEKGVPVPPSEPKKAELPELPKDVTEDVLVSIHQAQKLFYAGKHQDALREVRKSLSKKETALGYALLGSIYFTMGDLDSALSSWDVALEIDPLMTEVSEILEKYKR